jgi:hypothetical protein
MHFAVTYLVAAALLVMPFAAADAQTAPADWPGRTGRYVFDITRDGEPIGVQTIELRQNGGTVTAITESKVEVEILGITVYRMNQVLEETFEGTRLVALKAQTKDPDGLRKGEIARDGDRWTGKLLKEKRDFECDCKSTTMWHISSLDGSKIIEASEARPRSIKVEDKGLEALDLPEGRVQARRFTVSGEIERDVWYDAAGNLVASRQLGSDGSVIRLVLTSDPSGSRAPGTEAAQ